jgi:hypothetical protein
MSPSFSRATRRVLPIVLAGAVTLGACGSSGLKVSAPSASSTSAAAAAGSTSSAAKTGSNGDVAAFCSAVVNLPSLSDSASNPADLKKSAAAIAAAFAKAPAEIADAAKVYVAAFEALAKSSSNPAEMAKAMAAVGKDNGADIAKVATYIGTHCSNT